MKTVILAGGYGTRLSEETATIPKPMIEIGGQPLLWHLMKNFSQYGCNEFILPLGYKGEVIKKYFLEYSQLKSNLKVDLSKGEVLAEPGYGEDWVVDLVDTGQDTMTGGRLKRLQSKLKDTFIFTYGDGLSNVDITQLIAFHKSHGKLATITAVKPVSRFGLLKLGQNEQVTSFSEKPNDTDERVNGGFFVLEPEALDYIENDNSVWEKEACEKLVEEGQMMAYRHDDFWQCVDTLHELKLLREKWASGQADWKTWP